jgi:RND family efflux transporter MFP subunit
MTVLLTGIGSLVMAGPGPIPAVQFDTVTMLERSEPKIYVGTVGASDGVDIVARISGVLEEKPYHEGSIVKVGQLLFKIEDTIYAANVRAAKSVLAQMEAEYTFAKEEFDRYKALIETQATAKTTYDSAMRTLKLYEAKIEEAKADLILAENNLSYTKIYVPMDGMVGGNIYSAGNYITPDKGKLTTIVKFDPIKIRITMSEADFFRHFEKRNDTKVHLDVIRADGQKFKHPVHLDYIDNKVDPDTGTILIQFEAPNPDLDIIPGGYVRVYLTENFDKPLASINVAAIMTDGSNNYVYVVGKDNIVEKRDVVIGKLVYDRQTITSGLNAGDKVIVGGLHKAEPGKPVNPVAMPAPVK